jgi:hypothetical protein
MCNHKLLPKLYLDGGTKTIKYALQQNVMVNIYRQETGIETALGLTTDMGSA